MSKRELAEFLRHRREALRPEPAPAGRARRTPGLRREEVAWLAGVSTSYYERLEQARAPRPSTQVLAALATALRLTDTERAHLARLADQAPRGRDGAPDDAVPDDVRRLLDRLGPVPGYVVNPAQDIVAWNAMAAAVIADFAALPASERNVVRLSLRDGGTRCGAGEGTDGEFDRQVAAELRSAGARYPSEPAITELARAFTAHSPAFAAGWASHDVRDRPILRKRITHPELGELDLELQTLRFPGHDLRLVLCTAEPGSPSAAKLAALHRTTA
ncbi:helix-turn-helix transcriptional regulator [Pseudonocardia acaciae]|uniref:helix-turn-helix transcriptional regulator n=1 Tax=Pseudonocardia acaciae TaxID=551276 RepID=UPI00048B4F14|nr:helix-turn-helix transcriptional regulator [Pseudonocardia acaciae]